MEIHAMAVELDKETIAYLGRLVKRGGHDGETARKVLEAAGYEIDGTEILKYSDDQERDDHGRFAGGSGTHDEHCAAAKAATEAVRVAAGNGNVNLIGGTKAEQNAARVAHSKAALAAVEAHVRAANSSPNEEERQKHISAANVEVNTARSNYYDAPSNKNELQGIYLQASAEFKKIEGKA
jgi:hypothetical protein